MSKTLRTARPAATGPAEAAPASTGPRKIETLARCHAAAAIEALAGVLGDATATPAMRISAASALLQWGYGKPGLQARVKPAGGGAEEGGEQYVRLIWGEAENRA